jgi:hypothetical protein
MPNPQDADDALKLAALHTQIVMQWIKDLGHDPSVDSLAIGAIHGHIALCRVLRLTDVEIRRGLLAALNQALPVS